MAHEVEIINGEAQMAYAGSKPWHGLGVPVSNDLTPQQIQQKAGLDWEVTKEDLFLSDGQTIPGKKALVRSSDQTIFDVIPRGLEVYVANQFAPVRATHVLLESLAVRAVERTGLPPSAFAHGVDSDPHMAPQEASARRLVRLATYG